MDIHLPATLLIFSRASSSSISWCQKAYAASLWGGSIGGIVVGILVIIFVSLPLCCGVLKQYGKVGLPGWVEKNSFSQGFRNDLMAVF